MIINSNFLKPGSDRKMIYFENYFLVYDDNGVITYFGNDEDEIGNYQNSDIIDYKDKVILPGLIDLHSHIPQYTAIGTGSGKLLEWLEYYIFPLEAKFNNSDFAHKISHLFFQEAISFGTTTIVAYSNSSYEGTKSAFEEAKISGIRSYIGNALMDFNLPIQYTKSTEENKSISEKLISEFHSVNGKQKYILTPRYALVCSMDLLKWVGKISKESNLYIQTHLAENKSELEEIAKIYPQFETYTQIYDSANILHNRTLLAHGIYLNKSERELISDRGSSIIHCPSSNNYLQSGVFPLIEIKNDISVGIGTDVAGGTSLSVLNELKEAIETSKTKNMISGCNDTLLSSSEAMWISTKGNSIILGHGSDLADFEAGFEADFIGIDLNRLNILDNNINSDIICNKIVYLLANQKVDFTYIGGQRVY